jgi:structural hemagglutinin/hemolysin toxin protein RtxA
MDDTEVAKRVNKNRRPLIIFFSIKKISMNASSMALSPNKIQLRRVSMYKIIFYAPSTHVESIKKAMFDAHAGIIGNYQHCAWQVLGEGQFMPLQNSNAFVGKKNHLEKIPEYKVEMVCEDEYIIEIIQALKKSHPYETPAYQVLKMENF